MLFVAIISWKGISRFNGGAGGGFFFKLGGGEYPMGGISFDGRVFEKIVEFALAFQKH